MPAVFDREFVKRLDGPNVKKGKNKMDLAEQLRADIRNFMKDNGCDRAVMVWCASTEVYTPPTAVHQSLKTFEEGLRNNDPAISPSQIYTYAALKERVPYANGSPNVSVEMPCLQELALEMATPICGSDFKTGQTLMKTVIAPGLRNRQLGVAGWYSTNILGNRDGEVLDDPGSFKSKEVSKSGVLDRYLLGRALSGSLQRHLTTSCASTTTLRAAITKKAGTTSISSAGSAIRCRSRSTSSAATRSWRRRSFSTSRCSWTWRAARGCGASRNGCRFTSRRRSSKPGLQPEHDLSVQLLSWRIRSGSSPTRS